MKKAIILLILVLGTTTMSFAQKFAVIDMKYILSNMPEYADAQKKLDDQSAKWQKEIQDKYDAINKMNKDYESQQVLMTDDMKKQKQQEIQAKEKEAKELQKQYFGYQGDLFKLHEKLVKPIQDKVYDAVQKLATTKGYDIIFDKSESVYIMYVNPKLDVSDQVLTYLGYSPKNNPAGNNGSKLPAIDFQLPGSQSTPASTTPSTTPSSNPSPSPVPTPTVTPHQSQ